MLQLTSIPLGLVSLLLERLTNDERPDLICIFVTISEVSCFFATYLNSLMEFTGGKGRGGGDKSSVLMEKNCSKATGNFSFGSSKVKCLLKGRTRRGKNINTPMHKSLFLEE